MEVPLVLAAALRVGGMAWGRVCMRVKVAPESQAVTVLHHGQWPFGLRMRWAERRMLAPPDSPSHLVRFRRKEWKPGLLLVHGDCGQEPLRHLLQVEAPPCLGMAALHCGATIERPLPLNG